MTEREFALTVMVVRTLPFVDNVNVLANVEDVFIELSLRLLEALPNARRMFQLREQE